MSSVRGTFRWPKTFPELTPEQKRISDDFMHCWHARLAENKSLRPLENFNHGYSVRHRAPHFERTLEIGAGLGEHLHYEQLSVEQLRNYYALELRENMAEQLRQRYRDVNVIRGDCQKQLDFPDGYFSRIIAIHVLEHLPDLPAAIEQMHRLLSADGSFSVVIPCEGGFGYKYARMVSSQRMFERRYKQSYDWFIDREHVNVPAEILHVLSQHFIVENREFFPTGLPTVHVNLCIGLTLSPRS
jgi:SAM-dependent methyltransferase